MATYSVTDNGNNVAAGPKAYVQQVVVDHSSTNLGIGEDIDLFKIPANTLVISVGIELVTAGSNAGTLDVGDGDAADTWVTDLDADGTAGIQEFGTATKYYDSADTIDMKAITAAFDGKIRAWAVMVPVGADATAAAFA